MIDLSPICHLLESSSSSSHLFGITAVNAVDSQILRQWMYDTIQTIHESNEVDICDDINMNGDATAATTAAMALITTAAQIISR